MNLINMIIKKILNRIIKLFIRIINKTINMIEKHTMFYADYATNIFDFNYIVRQRNARSDEIFTGNSLYSIGYVLRRYSNYKGGIYCASEHGLPAGSTKDIVEYKDNDRKIVMVMSEDRREFLQTKTNKLLIPIGPSIMPYCTNIYSDFIMEDIKDNLGKTLLVFPQHSVPSTACLQTGNEFIDYIDKLVSALHYDTVLVCLYHEDIQRGEHFKYQKDIWGERRIVVTAGHKHNYDFADCMKTIINLSDHVVTQGYGSAAIYSIYLKKPVFYFPGNRGRKIENRGIVEDQDPWMQPYEEKLATLANLSFNNVSETMLNHMREDQWNWANKVYGFSETLTPEQIHELFEFAKATKRVNILDDRTIQKKLRSDKFKNIRELVEKSIRYRAEHLS